MQNQIEVRLMKEAEDFIAKLDSNTREKIHLIFEKQ